MIDMALNVLIIAPMIAIPAFIASHVSPYWYMGILIVFTLVWVLVTNFVDGLATVILMFIIAAGLAVAAGVHLVRTVLRQRGMNRGEITVTALIGSILAAIFLTTLFAR